MMNYQLKKLSIVFFFVLFIFTNPTVNILVYDTSSDTETVLDFEEELEEDNDDDMQKLFVSTFILSNFCSKYLQILSKKVLHTYRTNISLLKPPINS